MTGPAEVPVNRETTADAPTRPDAAAELRAATALLTRLPVRLPDGRSGSAAFPVVGAALGAIAAVPAVLLAGSAPAMGAMLALGVLAVATGVLHLDGLADTADALAAPDAARAEAARRDPRIGAAGAVALVLVLGAGAGALLAIPQWGLVGALVVAGAASRAVPAVAAPVLGGGADGAQGFGAWFAGMSGRGGAIVALATAALATIAAGLVTWRLSPDTGAGATTVLGPVLVALVGLGTGLAVGWLLLAWLRRQFGRLVGDHYGAAIEVTFLAALAVQAAAWGAVR